MVMSRAGQGMTDSRSSLHPGCLTMGKPQDMDAEEGVGIHGGFPRSVTVQIGIPGSDQTGAQTQPQWRVCIPPAQRLGPQGG
jgi:hypothetical protein